MGKGPPRPLPINILLGSGYAFDAYIHQGRGGGREGGIKKIQYLFSRAHEREGVIARFR